jgi:hypothetical protein
LIIFCACVYVGARGYQQFCKFDIAILRGCVERGPSAVLARVDWGAVVDEEFHHLHMPASGGGVERQVLHLIGRAGVD